MYEKDKKKSKRARTKRYERSFPVEFQRAFILVKKTLKPWACLYMLDESLTT
jgi:hypothetical protein